MVVTVVSKIRPKLNIGVNLRWHFFFFLFLFQVFYNNINIIKRAREGTGHTVGKGVSWTCSSEFDGTTKDSISFLNSDSFALMAKGSQNTGEM